MTTLAMFPLGTVLFPFAYLPLHVFEDRYRALARDCLKGDREFGVVLIDRGSEVGGGDRRTSIGTVARIVDSAETDDGRFALATVGTRRIRITRWLGEAPYPQAEVEPVEDGAWDEAAGAAFGPAERAVRRSLALLSELDEPGASMAVELAKDREAAAWQLAAIAPLGPLDRQSVLAAPGPADRLRLLTGLVEEASTVLAHRLAEG